MKTMLLILLVLALAGWLRSFLRLEKALADLERERIETVYPPSGDY
jgi:hypothetical protein